MELCQRLGEVLIWQARYSEAVETYKQMKDLAEECGNPVKLSIALQGLATSHGYISEHNATLKYSVEAQQAAQNANARIEIAKSLWMQGLAYYRLSEAQKTFTLSEQAFAIALELNDRNEMGRCLNLMAAALYTLGKYQQAEEIWEQALIIFEKLSNRRLGDYETAFHHFHNALEIAREVGYRDGEIVFLTNRGSAQVALQNYAAAEADLRKAIELAGIEGSWCLPYTYYYLAEALLGLGNYEFAYYSACQALALGREDRGLENIGTAWKVLGMISEKSGKPVYLRETGLGELIEYSTEDCFRKSAEILAEAEIGGEHARTLREWAKFEFRRNNKEQGAKLWEEARAIFEKLGATMEVERMAKLPS
jgi:tetratricopeptide (TPR) repeat protein